MSNPNPPKQSIDFKSTIATIAHATRANMVLFVQNVGAAYRHRIPMKVEDASGTMVCVVDNTASKPFHILPNAVIGLTDAYVAQCNHSDKYDTTKKYLPPTMANFIRVTDVTKVTTLPDFPAHSPATLKIEDRHVTTQQVVMAQDVAHLADAAAIFTLVGTVFSVRTFVQSTNHGTIRLEIGPPPTTSVLIGPQREPQTLVSEADVGKQIVLTTLTASVKPTGTYATFGPWSNLGLEPHAQTLLSVFAPQATFAALFHAHEQHHEPPHEPDNNIDNLDHLAQGATGIFRLKWSMVRSLRLMPEHWCKFFVRSTFMDKLRLIDQHTDLANLCTCPSCHEKIVLTYVADVSLCGNGIGVDNIRTFVAWKTILQSIAPVNIVEAIARAHNSLTQAQDIIKDELDSVLGGLFVTVTVSNSNDQFRITSVAFADKDADRHDVMDAGDDHDHHDTGTDDDHDHHDTGADDEHDHHDTDGDTGADDEHDHHDTDGDTLNTETGVHGPRHDRARGSHNGRGGPRGRGHGMSVESNSCQVSIMASHYHGTTP
jgi:hypothetical protein